MARKSKTGATVAESTENLTAATLSAQTLSDDEVQEVKKFLSNIEYYWQMIKARAATIDSPEFLGEPRVPTASADDSSNIIASTQFVKNALKSVSITGVIASCPTWYKRVSLFETDKTSVTIAANTQVNVGDNGYVNTSAVTLETSALGSASSLAGKDVYIYACQPDDEDSTEPVFVLSMNSTVPDGYTVDTSRKIGGFHCECADVGTISGHTYSGLKAGEIIDISAWDLLHRASSENEGMAYVNGIHLWADIYLNSYSGNALQSIYGGTICSGYSTEPFHGDKFAEYLGKINKRLPSRDEFIVFAKGSNEETNINGSASGVTAGGHSDTAGRRMISNYALEECCGHFWQWNSDQFGAFNSVGSSTTYQYGGAQATGENWYLMGYRWDRNNDQGISRVNEPNIDGSNTYGDCYGVVARALSGGYWDVGVGCGSRSVGLGILSARRASSYGCRGVSEPRVVNL